MIERSNEGNDIPTLPHLGAGTNKAPSTALIPHILIVDDDVAISEQLECWFSHTGYRVSVAYRAEQALELLEKEDVDLAVTAPLTEL